MAVTEPESPARQNHHWLLGEFQRLLLRQDPKSVLDVGCGAGQLMQFFEEHGVKALGLDQAGPRLEELRSKGLDVHAGSADDLPFAEDSVEWVTLRHVPHHLEHPARAFAEALRVARTGLLLAEPWFDQSVPSQRGWHAVDCWEKRQDRRGGMFHAEILDLKSLLARMPEGYSEHYVVESQCNLRLVDRPLEEFEERARKLVSTLPADHVEHQELDTLMQQLRQLGLSWNGSICVLLRRRIAP